MTSVAGNGGALGRLYQDGDIITRQGEVGTCMFVVQSGEVEVISERGGVQTVLRVAREGEVMGEMAVFDREVRSATLRARGDAYVMTLDKKNFLKRLHQDPSLAVRVIQTMSRRVRELGDQVAQLQRESRDDG
jgi:CRP-like cAMP-binding protein